MLFYELYLSFLYNINDSYNFSHQILSALFLIMRLTGTITKLKDIRVILYLVKICLSFYNVLKK